MARGVVYSNAWLGGATLNNDMRPADACGDHGTRRGRGKSGSRVRARPVPGPAAAAAAVSPGASIKPATGMPGTATPVGATTCAGTARSLCGSDARRVHQQQRQREEDARRSGGLRFTPQLTCRNAGAPLSQRWRSSKADGDAVRELGQCDDVAARATEDELESTRRRHGGDELHFLGGSSSRPTRIRMRSTPLDRYIEFKYVGTRLSVLQLRTSGAGGVWKVPTSHAKITPIPACLLCQTQRAYNASPLGSRSAFAASLPRHVLP